MEPFKRRTDASGPSLMATALALVAAFIVLVFLFFVFSSFASAFTGKCVAEVDIGQLHPRLVDRQ